MKKKEQNKNIKIIKSIERRNEKKIQNDTINTKKKVKTLISIYRNSRKTTQGIIRNIINKTINLIMKKTKNEF